MVTTGRLFSRRRKILISADHVFQFPGFKIRADIVDRRRGNIRQRFSGQKSLMGGNQNVRECQQSSQNIILEHLI